MLKAFVDKVDDQSGSRTVIEWSQGEEQLFEEADFIFADQVTSQLEDCRLVFVHEPNFGVEKLKEPRVFTAFELGKQAQYLVLQGLEIAEIHFVKNEIVQFSFFWSVDHCKFERIAIVHLLSGERVEVKFLGYILGGADMGQNELKISCSNPGLSGL